MHGARLVITGIAGPKRVALERGAKGCQTVWVIGYPG
jgi:hypothetical protein